MSNINEERCPKCFSLIGTWIDDPTLTKNGAKYIFDETSGLLIPELIAQRRYKGFTRIKSDAIKELQDIRHQQEIDSGISTSNQTIFSKVQSDEYGYWLISKNIIKELRESTEKILTATGQTKEEYFNYDENGIERQSPHQTDWIDLNFDTWVGHIKDMHIEDLRKAIIADVPMYCFNIGESHSTIPNPDPIINLMSEEKVMSTLLSYDGWVAKDSWIQMEYGYGEAHAPDYQPYKNQSEFDTGHGYPPYTEDPINGDWYVNFHTWVYAFWISCTTSKSNFIWRVYKSSGTNNNHKQSILAVPRTNNKNLNKYEIKEIYGSPTPVDETYGYPAVRYTSDPWNIYPVPKTKSSPFLEDVINNVGSTFDLTKYGESAESNCAFKITDLSPNAYASGTEEHFERRRMDSNSWGLSDPCAEQIADAGGSTYFRSASRYGTNALGSCSLFIPKNWNLGNLSNHKEQIILNWTLTQKDIKWNIDVTTEHIEESIYDVSTDTYKTLHFGNNCLLTKTDGAIIAKGWEELTQTLSSGNTINLPTDTIARTVDCWVDGILWTQVDDFTSSLPDDAHYTISGDVLSFGDNTHGKLPTGSSIHIETYTQEIITSKYYASGYIVIQDKDYGLVGITVYVILNYYNVPNQYYAQAYEITAYDVDYISKPSTLNPIIYSHTEEPPYYPPEGSPSSAIILHTVSSPLAYTETIVG